MILIALGGNRPHPVHGSPRRTLEAALRVLESRGIQVLRRSRWYASKAWPPSDQPDYANGAAAVETGVGPEDLLAILHEIEVDFGRERSSLRNEARPLDLDLIAYHQEMRDDPDGLQLPHPRMAERAFVLLPLLEVAPDWRHPKTGASIVEMARELGGDSSIKLLEDA